MEQWYLARPALRYALEAKGWTLRALAVETAYSRSHLSNVIKGRFKCRGILAERLAALGGSDLLALFELAENDEA